MKKKLSRTQFLKTSVNMAIKLECILSYTVCRYLDLTPMHLMFNFFLHWCKNIGFTQFKNRKKLKDFLYELKLCLLAKLYY